MDQKNPKPVVSAARFSRSTIISRAKTGDLILSTSGVQHIPQFLFLRHKDQYSKRDFTFHSGPTNTSTVLATGEDIQTLAVTKQRVRIQLKSQVNEDLLNKLFSVTEIKELHEPRHELFLNLSLRGQYREFHYAIPRIDLTETFRWKNTWSSMVQVPGGTGSGMKLVRMRNDDVVAVWAEASPWKRNSWFDLGKKKGVVSFVGERLNDEFELLAVMSLLIAIDKREI